ncbi:MAG: hypothetical protein N7Q72_03490 [Spiroplasma sp. Tabriz.8]|nr:hypothetical protein [Spiroplasma sp. Tabriz.8]
MCHLLKYIYIYIYIYYIIWSKKTYVLFIKKEHMCRLPKINKVEWG